MDIDFNILIYIDFIKNSRSKYSWQLNVYLLSISIWFILFIMYELRLRAVWNLRFDWLRVGKRVHMGKQTYVYKKYIIDLYEF